MPHSLAAKKDYLAEASEDEVAMYKFPQKVATHKLVPSSTSKETPHLTNLSFSPDGAWLVAIEHTSKSLMVFNASDLAIVSSRVFPKRPSAFAFIGGSKDLLVGDKFGDVYRVPLESAEPIVDAKGACLIEPVLGHVSMLLALICVPGKIITSDRDEHIRISDLAKPYEIERFLFGHTEYVTCLCAIGNVLVSGGGDKFIVSWDYTMGAKLDQLDIAQHLQETLEEINVSHIEVFNDNEIVVAVEGSSQLLRFTVPDFELVRITDTGSNVVDLAVDGTDIYVASATQIARVQLDGQITDLGIQFPTPSVPVLKQHHLRKRPEV